MRYASDTIFDQATAAGSYNSETVELPFQFGYSVCATTVGAGTGSCKLQASVDGITFVDVTGSSQNFTAAGSMFFNVSDAFYKSFRVVLTVATGTPTATIKFFSKGF
jgi:hypothetical protein